MTTREPKSGDLLHDELLDRWRRIGVDVGIDEHAVARWLDRGATTNQWLDEHRFAAALSNSDHAAATRRSVVQAWADASASGGRVTAVESSAEWAMAFDASVRALPGDHAEVPGPPGRLLPPAQLLAPGIAEPVQAIGRIVAPRYLLRALGPRPLHHRAQAAWRDAALGIERYRERWAVGDANYALGPDNDLGRMSVSQLADRIRVSQLIERGTRALSHERGRVVERSGPDIGAR